MSQFNNFRVPYSVPEQYQTKTAYFCMEYGIDQALKIYSGGLGYLAGSHLRSAYQLKQNFIGIGILWRTGYYDQGRNIDQSMKAQFLEKDYHFLEDTGITFQISVNQHPVGVKVWYLNPETFGTAPLFLLSTDLPENDYLARSICHRLYDSNVEAKIAQYILLGVGGCKLLEALGFNADRYHLNEAHGLPAAYYLYQQWGSLEAVRQKMVITTHTPVEAGNEKHDIRLLDRMGFFSGLSRNRARELARLYNDSFNMTLVGLRVSHVANGVSKLHGQVARGMWGNYEAICPITHVTYSQIHLYWSDKQLDAALAAGDDATFRERKSVLKGKLFAEVANQCGKIFREDVLTIVWARRFAGYKRADLITRDLAAFEALVHSTRYPVQIIWAGKPYPTDYEAVTVFNHLVHLSKNYANCAVLVGYELALSKLLKQGSDIWLNTPRVPREASGTSGMTAAMNASVNFSTNDGWIPEFAQHGENSFIVPEVDAHLPHHEQDEIDRRNLLRVLNEEILPLYYDRPNDWLTIVKNSMNQVIPFFDSDRMADEYYRTMYQASYSPLPESTRMLSVD